MGKSGPGPKTNRKPMVMHHLLGFAMIRAIFGLAAHKPVNRHMVNGSPGPLDVLLPSRWARRRTRSRPARPPINWWQARASCHPLGRPAPIPSACLHICMITRLDSGVHSPGGGGIARAYSSFLTSTAWSADTQRWCSGCRWRCSWQVRLASESPCRTTPTQRVRMYPHPRHPPARRAAGTRMRRRCSPPPPPTPRWAARASATGSVCCRLTV